MASRDVRVAIIGDASGLRGALREAETGLAGFSRRMSRVGDQMRSAGRRLTTGITLPVVAVGGLAVKAAVDFESAFAGVRKTVDATERQFATLETGIRDMAKEIPATAVEIAAVAEAAGQLGIKTEDILAFTRVMIDLGETTNLTADEAATAMARFANVTSLPADKFDELGSVIVELGNNMATTEAEIVEFATRLSGAGTQLGLSQDEILAISAAMSEVGIQAEAGGTAMSRVFNAMGQAAAGNESKLEAFASVAGTTAEEFRRVIENSPEDAVLAFVDGLGDLDANAQAEALGELGLSGERVLSALQRLAGKEGAEGLAEALGLASAAWGENTALTDEANQRYDTTAARMDVLKNKFTDVGISLGESLIPVLEDLAGALEGAIEWFEGLSDSQKDMVKWAAVAAAALGPLLWVVGGIATAVGAIATPVGLAVVGLVGLGVAAKVAYDKFEPFKAIIDDLWQAVQDVADAFDDLLEALGIEEIDKRKVAVGLLAAAFAPLVIAIGGAAIAVRAFAEVLEWMLIGGTVAVNGLKMTWDTLNDAIDRVYEAIQPVIAAVTFVGGLTLGALAGQFNNVKTVVGGVKSAVEGAINIVKELGRQTLGGLQSAISGVAGVIERAYTAAKNLASALRNLPSKIPVIGGGLDTALDAVTGGSFTGGITPGGPRLVGESGPELAFLPKGTRVRTASRTKNAMSGGGGGVTPEDIRYALSGMRFEVGDGFVRMVTDGLLTNRRAAA